MFIEIGVGPLFRSVYWVGGGGVRGMICGLFQHISDLNSEVFHSLNKTCSTCSVHWFKRFLMTLR